MPHFSLSPRRAAEPRRGFAAAWRLVAVFAGLAGLSRLMTFQVDQLIWPADGALVVAMLILPARQSLMVLASAFCINIAVNLLTSYSLRDSAITAVLNISLGYMAAVLTRRFCGARTDLSRLGRLSTFAAIAFSSAGVEAALGESLIPGQTDGTLPGLLHDWLQWTLCDGLGLLLSTPAILLWIKHRREADAYPAGPAERRWLALAGAAFAVLAFTVLGPPWFLLIFPLLVLTAFRAGPAWVLAAILGCALIATWTTVHGLGPFASLSIGHALRAQDLLQVYLFAIFLTAVPANSALGDMARWARRLLRLKSLLEHSASHDALTGLANRVLFKTRLASALARGASCALLFIDLNRFKLVNDSLGHAAGDELLRTLGARLVEAVGDGVTIARLGGDEFALLVETGMTESEQEALCHRIEDVARRPFRLGRGLAVVSASIGLAAPPPGGVDASELMRRADIALYMAKAGRKGGFRVYNDDLDHAVRTKASIEAGLRAAVERARGRGAGADDDPAGLQLHWQPKLDRQGAVTGVEGLLRWTHPSLGPVAAEQLVAVAEETDLIIALGDWVLREALRFAARWPGLDVAVNVSPTQLRHAGFVDELLEAYEGAPAARGRLELEITESALMDDLEVVNARLATLRNAGIRIALDDFGAGYSSLARLHRCAVDRVKIDRSFVSGQDGGAEASAIVRAIVQLGHAMKLQVTAEGVETGEQRGFLVDAGVDEMQGYLFSRPLDEAAFARFMRERFAIAPAGGSRAIAQSESPAPAAA